jgi:hypothetical protein
MSRLFTGVAVIAICLSLLAGRAASARPQAQSRAGTTWVGITGWGNVTLGKGFVEHRTVRCAAASCPSERFPIRARRIVMIARPYKGWKLTGWQGAERTRFFPIRSCRLPRLRARSTSLRT